MQNRAKPFTQSHIIRTILLAACLTTLSSICIFSLSQNTLPTHTTVLKSNSKVPADHCHIVANNPNNPKIWLINSKSICVTSPVCFSTQKIGSFIARHINQPQTTCQMSTPLLQPSPTQVQLKMDRRASCSTLQYKLVTCAFGTGLARYTNITCPAQLDINHFSSSDPTEWLEDITLIVPDFPHRKNIYHFANAVSSISWAVNNIDTLLDQYGRHKLLANDANPNPRIFTSFNTTNLNLLLHTQFETSPWQKSLMEIFSKKLSKTFNQVNFIYLQPPRTNKSICVRNPIQLGRRGHVNTWPFPNGTTVDLDGRSVPIEAVDFRKTVYKGTGVHATLPDYKTNKLLSDLPPLVVGYARRLKPKDPTFIKRYPLSGYGRHFTDKDEAWFLHMLYNETKAAGIQLKVFSIRKEHSFKQQVEVFSRIGMVVGIHGANLVNSLFIKPFGVLLEVVPKHVISTCYIAGSNSGLAYFRHNCIEEDKPIFDCTNMTKRICGHYRRSKRPAIETETDRKALVEEVRSGLTHLIDLHKKFPNGIPVYVDKEAAYYRIRD